MDGEAAPDAWQGGLNCTYRLGPNLINDHKLNLDIHTDYKRATVYNVIGVMRGSVEPGEFHYQTLFA